MDQVTIRTLLADDLSDFRRLRAQALRSNPECFGESDDELLASSMSDFLLRMEPRTTFPQQFTLGAFSQNVLVGTVALRRETRTKYRHRAFIWGMYVATKLDRRAIGEALVSELINIARSIEGIEQIDVQVESNTRHDIDVLTALRFEHTGTHRHFIKIGRNQYHDVECFCLDLTALRQRLPNE